MVQLIDRLRSGISVTASRTFWPTSLDFSIVHRNTVVATHVRHPRQQVVMVPAHYAGLLRVDTTPLTLQPPQHDPRCVGVGTVDVRDLGVYERFAAQDRWA